MKARTFGGANFSNIPNLQSQGGQSQMSKNQFKGSSHMSYDHTNSMSSKDLKSNKNLQHYTFGGMTNIRQTPLYNQLVHNNLKINSEVTQNSEVDYESGRQNHTGYAGMSSQHEGDYFNLQKPQKAKVANFFDQAYGTDIRKKARERPMSCKSGYSRKSHIMERLKAYKAPNPYKGNSKYVNKKQSKKGSRRFK